MVEPPYIAGRYIEARQESRFPTILNRLPVITQIPLTKLEGKGRKVYPFEVLFPKEVVGTEWTSIAMLQQVRTIDRARLLEKIGELNDTALQAQIENRILEHFGIAFEIEDA
jgi:mRNA-degrading endonuclease toxin of MazEF toxin-antitoxin module